MKIKASMKHWNKGWNAVCAGSATGAGSIASASSINIENQRRYASSAFARAKRPPGYKSASKRMLAWLSGGASKCGAGESYQPASDERILAYPSKAWPSWRWQISTRRSWYGLNDWNKRPSEKLAIRNISIMSEKFIHVSWERLSVYKWKKQRNRRKWS